MKKFNLLLSIVLLFSFAAVTGCDEDEPAIENEEEIITDVILSFKPIGGGTEEVTAVAQDPDGEGPQDIEVQGSINLVAGAEYILEIDLLNTTEGTIVLTDEIKEEAEEHMFFFGFSDAVFFSPAGDGNIDNREDPVDYQDFDSNGEPLGLKTHWATENATASGTFHVVLKHQPGIKSATSGSENGETDLDLTWNVEVE
jgi:hypothetical protein